jgi:DNA adenine methylase
VPKITRHECYCEVFAGGLAVLLAKEPSKIEVVNDLNSDLVNFYRCVRFHCDELIKEIQWTVTSREEFAAMKASKALTDIQRAALWFRIQSVSFGGDGESYGIARKSGGAVNKSRYALMEKIGQLNARLDRVNIENLDWERCLRLYDSPETFFFLDPPYIGGSIKNYEAWTREHCEHLREVLEGLKGRWLLTINDSEETRSVFNGLRLLSLKRRLTIRNNTGSQKEYAELLISPRA